MTSEFDAILAIAGKLAGVSFATLMVLITFGSYFGIWSWGKTHRADVAEKVKECADMKADFKKREEDLQKRNDLLFELAMRATGMTEQTVSVLKRQI